MAYIRLYSKALSLRKKRRIARQLISIAQQAFELPPDKRPDITIQFAPTPISRPDYCAVLEVSGQRFDPYKMASFVTDVSSVLAKRFGRSSLRRWFGLRDGKMVAVEFKQMALQAGSDLHASRLRTAA